MHYLGSRPQVRLAVRKVTVITELAFAHRKVAAETNLVASGERWGGGRGRGS